MLFRSAAGAQVKVHLVAPAGAEFDDGLLGTGRVAVVAFEAVAAGQAALRLAPRLGFGQSGHHLAEIGAPVHRHLGLCGAVAVEEQRQVECGECRHRILRHRRRRARRRCGAPPA